MYIHVTDSEISSDEAGQNIRCDSVVGGVHRCDGGRWCLAKRSQNTCETLEHKKQPT